MKNIIEFLRKYPELLTIPAALAVWIFSITVLRWFDPTSAVYDAGVFQVPIFAVLQLLIYVSVSWVLLNMVFGTAGKFLKTDLKTEFQKLTPWEKIKFAYGLFLSLLFTLTALSYTLN